MVENSGVPMPSIAFTPFILFWVLVYLGRDELGLKGAGLCVLIWLALLAGCVVLAISPYVFVALQALFDIILLLVIFHGDITIR